MNHPINYMQYLADGYPYILPYGYDSNAISLLEELIDRKAWDPTFSRFNLPLTMHVFDRINKDLLSIYRDPPPGIHVTHEKTDVRYIHALIEGPANTPYEGGMFYFLLKCPLDYPMKPPKVKLITTDNGRVEFNPSILASGKLYLSVLGTTEGPCWTPDQQIGSLLISIQSMLTENPIMTMTEPDCLGKLRPFEARRYNNKIVHETIRVAVIGMFENEWGLYLPPDFEVVMDEVFLKNYKYYVRACEYRICLDGIIYRDPSSSKELEFDFSGLLVKLHELKKKIEQRRPPSDGDSVVASEYETEYSDEGEEEENEENDYGTEYSDEEEDADQNDYETEDSDEEEDADQNDYETEDSDEEEDADQNDYESEDYDEEEENDHETEDSDAEEDTEENAIETEDYDEEEDTDYETEDYDEEEDSEDNDYETVDHEDENTTKNEENEVEDETEPFFGSSSTEKAEEISEDDSDHIEDWIILDYSE